MKKAAILDTKTLKKIKVLGTFSFILKKVLKKKNLFLKQQLFNFGISLISFQVEKIKRKRAFIFFFKD